MSFFRVIRKSRKSHARTGVITTKHGSIQTPSFVPVATKGTLKAIPPNQLKEIGVQVAFVNTFHLTVHPGVDVIKKFGGIHKYGKLDVPPMSDSAGFQVFSLGDGKQNKSVKTREGDEASLEKIEEKGVRFRSPRDGRHWSRFNNGVRRMHLLRSHTQVYKRGYRPHTSLVAPMYQI